MGDPEPNAAGRGTNEYTVLLTQQAGDPQHIHLHIIQCTFMSHPPPHTCPLLEEAAGQMSVWPFLSSVSLILPFFAWFEKVLSARWSQISGLCFIYRPQNWGWVHSVQ